MRVRARACVRVRVRAARTRRFSIGDSVLVLLSSNPQVCLGAGSVVSVYTPIVPQADAFPPTWPQAQRDYELELRHRTCDAYHVKVSGSGVDDYIVHIPIDDTSIISSADEPSDLFERGSSVIAEQEDALKNGLSSEAGAQAATKALSELLLWGGRMHHRMGEPLCSLSLVDMIDALIEAKADVNARVALP